MSHFPPSIVVPCPTSIFILQSPNRIFYFFLQLSHLLREQMNLLLFNHKITTCAFWCKMFYLPCSIAFRQSAMALFCPKSKCKSSYFITILNEMKISEVSLLWLNICLTKMKLPLFELMKIKWTASEFNWVTVWIISMVGPTAIFGD